MCGMPGISTVSCREKDLWNSSSIPQSGEEIPTVVAWNSVLQNSSLVHSVMDSVKTEVPSIVLTTTLCVLTGEWGDFLGSPRFFPGFIYLAPGNILPNKDGTPLGRPVHWFLRKHLQKCYHNFKENNHPSQMHSGSSTTTHPLPQCWWLFSL